MLRNLAISLPSPLLSSTPPVVSLLSLVFLSLRHLSQQSASQWSVRPGSGIPTDGWLAWLANSPINIWISPAKLQIVQQ